MRLPQTIDDYKKDLRRFLRIAEKKNARLVIFPELAGTMLVPPLLQDFRSSLLKRSDLGRRATATVWQRLSLPLYASAATIFRANLRHGLDALLEVAPTEVLDTYSSIFSELSREYGVTIVAPSAYLPERLTGQIQNLAGVFGPNGEELGYQGKVMIHPNSDEPGTPSEGWDVVPTEVGRLGIILGSDVLYPEVGRLLAYQGAEALISVAACLEPVQYNKVRSGMLARMQDNQLFGVSSFLVGNNEIVGNTRSAFVGRSAIFAPQELTPRLNGVMVEMGNQTSEGVITAEWNFAELRDLWENSETPLRQTMSDDQVKPLMGQLYDRLKRLPIFRAQSKPAAQIDAIAPGEDVTLTLDELPVVNSISSRWPLPDELDLVELPFEQNTTLAEFQTLTGHDGRTLGADDETEELDALSGNDLNS